MMSVTYGISYVALSGLEESWLRHTTGLHPVVIYFALSGLVMELHPADRYFDLSGFSESKTQIEASV
jgi:hypothetical protein